MLRWCNWELFAQFCWLLFSNSSFCYFQWFVFFLLLMEPDRRLEFSCQHFVFFSVTSPTCSSSNLSISSLWLNGPLLVFNRPAQCVWITSLGWLKLSMTNQKVKIIHFQLWRLILCATYFLDGYRFGINYLIHSFIVSVSAIKLLSLAIMCIFFVCIARSTVPVPLWGLGGQFWLSIFLLELNFPGSFDVITFPLYLLIFCVHNRKSQFLREIGQHLFVLHFACFCYYHLAKPI